MDIVEPKREHAQRIEEPDTDVLKENENTCNKTDNIPRYEISENSIWRFIGLLVHIAV